MEENAKQSETSTTNQDLTDEQIEKEIERLSYGLDDNSSNNTEQSNNNNSSGNSSNDSNDNNKALKKKEVKPSLFQTNHERFHFLCKDFPSPNIFIDFDFYFMIGACLGRRIWMDSDNYYGLFPNIYLVCVSAPGLGKSLPARLGGRILKSLKTTVVDKMTNKLEERSLLNLGPDAITFEKLVLRAAAASQSAKMSDGRVYNHSSTTFCLGDEMGTLFSENTKRVVSFLTQAFDCGDWEGDTIKHGEKLIKNICINFLGCCNPDFMAELSRTKVINNGFIGRFIPLWADKKRPHPARIIETEEQINEADYLRRHLRKLCLLKPGRINYTPEANAWIDNWHKNKSEERINEHPKLLDYYARKKETMKKLAVCHAYAESLLPVLEVRHLVSAENLLLRAEPMMHKALALGGENPLFNLSENIKGYLTKKGSTQRRKLVMEFYSECKDGVDGLAAVFDYLINTDQCEACTVDGRDGLRLKGNKIK